MDLKEILKKYWGFTTFRPLQEDIIQSVLEGNDTLALLPTGGGKSVCFQVPAMAKEGLCLVISPLIALMNDQVQNLKDKGIKAAAIHSGMSRKEIIITLDNCLFGDVKFLYLSPERLETELFRLRAEKMTLNLIAVDEAHCISQWGYDFRPSYLKIADIRPLFPKTPVLALTATATPVVTRDIQEKLQFPERNIFQKSFERKNLAYVVLHEEGKYRKLLKILKKIKGSAVVYVRSRKGTRDIAAFLRKEKINADFYHAGLNASERSAKQDRWIRNKIRVMVSTNAFGMGIDKPDVRSVVHMDLPDSLEAYFQEAGRAGRDGKKSYAVLLYNFSDKIDLEKRMQQEFPPPDKIREVYHALGNYLKLAVGAGKGESLDFDIKDFCNTFEFQSVIVYNALKVLEQNGWIMVSDSIYLPSRVKINFLKDRLYKFEIENIKYEPLIKFLIRAYGGIFENFTPIRENEIARYLKISVDEVKKYLKYLQKQEVLIYEPQKDKPQITYTEARASKENLLIDRKQLEERKKVKSKNVKSVIAYASTSLKCRSQQLLNYFGEFNLSRCGHCDVCLDINKLHLSDQEYKNILSQLKDLLKENSLELPVLVEKVKGARENQVIEVLRWLSEHQALIISDDNKVKISNEF